MNREKRLVAYLAIPIVYCQNSKKIEEELTASGIVVKNPCSLITDNVSQDQLRQYISAECYKMIDSADFLVLYADYYGRDCATEVGYAAHAGKPVFPYSLESKDSYNIDSDWMIYPKVQSVSKSINELLRKIADFFPAEAVSHVSQRRVHLDKRVSVKVS